VLSKIPAGAARFSGQRQRFEQRSHLFRLTSRSTAAAMARASLGLASINRSARDPIPRSARKLH